MKKIVLGLILLLLLASACGSNLRITQLGSSPGDSWGRAYVSGMHGVENLAFDGKGSLYVCGLDGMLYKLAPAAQAFRGKIVAEKKMGKTCLGIESGTDGMLYVAVREEKGDRRIVRIDSALTKATPLTDPIPGLNGFEQDHGYLYYTSSNESMLRPKGAIYRVRMGSEKNFKNPEVFVKDAGMVNGLAFSPDGKVLYYTETFNGLWMYDIARNEKKKIYSPSGLMHVFDDLTVGPDGTVWMCLNSECAIVAIKDGKPIASYRVGDLKAPSSCEFGRGPGFDPGYLYITEFGLKGRSFTMNGRGVWVLPLKTIRGMK